MFDLCWDALMTATTCCLCSVVNICEVCFILRSDVRCDNVIAVCPESGRALFTHAVKYLQNTILFYSDQYYNVLSKKTLLAWLCFYKTYTHNDQKYTTYNLSLSQIVLYRKEEVKSCDCDMPSVHHLLSKMPQDLPYEDLIGRARSLFESCPPSLLAQSATLQSHNM